MSLTVTDLGTIVSIAKNVEKGYTRLVIDNPVPWKTRYLKFNVWRTAKLCHDHSIPFKTGDMVSVEYTQDQNFNRLISLEPLQSTQVDSCLVCHALYELPRDGQKIDCGYCSIFDSNRRKRLNCELKLIAISEKQCKHSVGLCLTFAGRRQCQGGTIFRLEFRRQPYARSFSRTQATRDIRRYRLDNPPRRQWGRGQLYRRIDQSPRNMCKIIM